MQSIPGKPLILASRSSARQDMLAKAGIRFTIETAPVDEDSLRDAGAAEGVSSVDMATALAEAKAVRVSLANPAALVIGSDQLLDCGGQWFGKPDSIEDAAESLRALSGKTHRLVTAAVLYQGGRRIWQQCEQPEVSIRPLDDAAISAYLTTIGAAALVTPGVYQIESYGAQILSRIDGCPYAVLGMPLLGLLASLREHGLTEEAAA